MQQALERKVRNQGWIMRLLEAVADRTLGWLVSCDVGMSPQEAQLIFHDSGSYSGKTRISQSLARIKVGKEE